MEEGKQILVLFHLQATKHVDITIGASQTET